jgi:hypothetical protein
MKLGLILSTGRTGTQFFEDYITETSDNHLCLHEPKFSRRFKFFSNLLIQHKIQEDFVERQFIRKRQKRLKENTDWYIESNNFLFGCVNAIAKSKRFETVKILHLVRYPQTYAQSHLNHGFWRGHKKLFAKYVPYWIENVKKYDVPKNDAHKLLLARWDIVNRTILASSSMVDTLTIRFEDLFSHNETNAINTLNSIRNFFEMDNISNNLSLKYLSQPKNKSKKKFAYTEFTHSDKEFILSHSADLLEKFNYSI